MSARLTPGNRCYFLSEKGRKIRCVVVESMNLKARGEELLVPVFRPINRKAQRCRADGQPEARVVWKKRSELRKLPKK